MSQQINLFNPIFLKEKKYFSALTMLQALGIMLAGVAAFYAYARVQVDGLARQAEDTSVKHRQVQERLTRTTAQFAPKPVDASLETEIAGLQSQLNARQAMIGSLGTGVLTNESGYAEYMRALARQSVAGLWLTGFRIGERGEQMQIDGRALRPDLVPLFIERLNREQVMRGRAFDALMLTRKQAPIPAASAAVPPAGPATVPPAATGNYTYTEFQLGSSHAQLVARSAAEPPSVAPPQVEAGAPK